MLALTWIGYLLVAAGGVAAGVGFRALLTGRNYGGRWGRGLTRADDARLAGAPPSYFRAVGALVGILGALAVCVGGTVIQAVATGSVWMPVIAMIGILLAALVFSGAVLAVVATRNGLGRFQAPRNRG